MLEFVNNDFWYGLVALKWPFGLFKVLVSDGDSFCLDHQVTWSWYDSHQLFQLFLCHSVVPGFDDSLYELSFCARFVLD